MVNALIVVILSLYIRPEDNNEHRKVSRASQAKEEK